MTKQSERLKAAMKLARIKQTVLAEKTGIVQGTISNYARGVYAPHGENLTKLADALGVSEAWLAGFDVPMAPEASGSLSASDGEREFLNSREDWSFFRLSAPWIKKPHNNAVFLVPSELVTPF